MKTKVLILTLILLASAASSRAGDDVLLDQHFAFRLTPTAPEQSPSTALPIVPGQPRQNGAPPLQTPEGAPLPPGSRPREFNGQTYYFIPL